MNPIYKTETDSEAVENGLVVAKEETGRERMHRKCTDGLGDANYYIINGRTTKVLMYSMGTIFRILG